MHDRFRIDEAKKAKQIADGFTNATGKTYRTQANMAWARCLFLDLDVGKDYHDRKAAIAALKEFVSTTGLPKPMVVSSGRGFHLYWPLTEDISADDWKPHAAKLKRLCEYHRFRVDPTRVADATSLLRVPGTKHLKDPSNPLDVCVMALGSRPMAVAGFVSALERACQLTPFGAAQEVPSRREPLTEREPVGIEQLAKACAQVDHLIRNPAAASEPEWYKLLGVTRFCANGRTVSHDVSKGHPSYDPEETDKKLDQLEREMPDGKHLGPTTCSSMAEACGQARCRGCWYARTPDFTPSSSPLVAARRRPQLQLSDFHAVLSLHQYIHIQSGELLPAPSVDGVLPRVKIISPEGRAIHLRASQYLDAHRAVLQLIWAPGEPQVLQDRITREGELIENEGTACFNLYRSPKPQSEGIPSKAEPWVDHVRRVFGDDADHIIKFLAHRVQRPGEKINHALLLGGMQGIGKDTILEPLKEAVGSWNFHEISPHHLTGRFNSYVKAVILRINEAHDLGEQSRHQFYERMKNLAAAPPPTLRVDEKHLREHHVLNCCGVIITTNHKTGGIYLPPEDRRHFVAWSRCEASDFPEAYWSELYGWYDRGGRAHVAAFLANYDLSSFNPKAPPNKTAAFWEIVHANRAPEDAELAGAIEALGNPEALTLRQLQGAVPHDFEFGLWLRDRKNRRHIGHRLDNCGYSAVRNPTAKKDGLWNVGKERVAIYAQGDLDERDRLRAASALCAGGSGQ